VFELAEVIGKQPRFPPADTVLLTSGRVSQPMCLATHGIQDGFAPDCDTEQSQNTAKERQTPHETPTDRNTVLAVFEPI
jgi:hypothetical protein